MNGSVTRTGPYADDGGAALDEAPDPRTSIATWAGFEMDITRPETWRNNFNLEDISRSLSNMCRFNGHVDFYSVAEHAVRVSYILEEWGLGLEIQFMGLHHDDTEAYFGDIPSPQKKLLRIGESSFKDWEEYMANFHLFPWLGITPTEEMHRWVKTADYESYLLERAERPRPRIQPALYAMGPKVAQTIFMARHERLLMQMEESKQ